MEEWLDIVAHFLEALEPEALEPEDDEPDCQDREPSILQKDTVVEEVGEDANQIDATDDYVHSINYKDLYEEGKYEIQMISYILLTTVLIAARSKLAKAEELASKYRKKYKDEKRSLYLYRSTKNAASRDPIDAEQKNGDTFESNTFNMKFL